MTGAWPVLVVRTSAPDRGVAADVTLCSGSDDIVSVDATTVVVIAVKESILAGTTGNGGVAVNWVSPVDIDAVDVKKSVITASIDDLTIDGAI